MLKRSMLILAAAATFAAGPAAAQLDGGGGCGSTNSPEILDLGGGLTKVTQPDGSYVVTQTLVIDPETGETITVVVESGWNPPREAEVNC